MKTSILRILGCVLSSLTIAAIAIGYGRNHLPLHVAGFVVLGVLPLLSLTLFVTGLLSLFGENRLFAAIQLLVALWGGYVFYSLVFLVPM